MESPFASSSPCALVLASLLFSFSGCSPLEPVSWMHNVVLDGEAVVHLFWTPDEDEVTFQVEARTRGYVGIGFSPTGSMKGSDLVLFWIDDSTQQVFFSDYHAVGNSAPLLDAEQSYSLLGAYQNDTHTVVRFSREWNTCDSEDMELSEDTVRLIWAYHPEDPQDGTLIWHGVRRRGSRSLHLKNPPTRKIHFSPQIQHWDIKLNNFTIPDNMDTIYWCKIFKVPPLGRKHHMIGYKPIIQPGNEGFVHHILIYECVAPRLNIVFEKYLQHDGAACYSPNMPEDWESCLTPIVAWAVGSEGEFFPEHVGLPLADENKATYFRLEIHYDNPAFRRVQDNSGIRIFYTESLRSYDGGILVNGIVVTPLHLIPPKQIEYTNAGYCSSQCTSMTLPRAGIKVLSVLMHSHLAGKKMKLRHIRNGKELPKIAEDDHYDFNYQQPRTLSQEVTVLPGDELVMECSYQTANRSEPTFGGFSTKEEMCLSFILYYPRIQLASCCSMAPVKTFFETFGVKEFYNTDMDSVERMLLRPEYVDPDIAKGLLSSTTQGIYVEEHLFGQKKFKDSSQNIMADYAGADINDEANQRAINALKQMKDFTIDEETAGLSVFGKLFIKQPQEFQNRSFMNHLYELPWTEQLLTKRIEESLHKGKHLTFCRLNNDALVLPAQIQDFPQITEEAVPKKTKKCENSVRQSVKAKMQPQEPQMSTSSASSCTYSISIILLYIYLLTYD